MSDGITSDDMAAISQKLDKSLGLPIEAQVELAGYAVAKAAMDMLGEIEKKQVVVLAGPGFTGATALVAANRLNAWGVMVTTLTIVDRNELSPTTAALADRLEMANGHVYGPGAPLPIADLWIDGLYGYKFHEPLGDELKSTIDAINRDNKPILSVDVPTGLDATTGKATLPAIRATKTIAIGYPKIGLLKPYAKQLVGELLVADVGIPPVAWRNYQLPFAPDFHGEPYISWENK